MSIFHEIREKSAWVAENARWVQVREDKVILYPERLLVGDHSDLSHTEEHHLLGRGDDTIRFFIILDSLNFGSGYFPYLDKEHGVSGYFTVAKRLKNFCVENGIPTAKELTKIDTSTCAQMLSQDIYNPHMEELMHLFSIALVQLGKFLEQEFGGDYLGLLSRNRSASDVVNSLSKMAFFRDEAVYFGEVIPFYKRAQILLQDIKIACPSSEYIEKPDIDELTVFADNILPYVFAADGLLEIHPWVEGRIQKEELIGSGSPEEIELRACSIYIGEMLAEIIRCELRPISVRELDFHIWNRGQKLKKMVDRKRHRTRCTYY